MSRRDRLGLRSTSRVSARMVNSAARRCSVSAWWRASRAFGDEGVYFLVAGVELIVKGQLALGAVGQVFDEGDDLADV